MNFGISTANKWILFKSTILIVAKISESSKRYKGYGKLRIFSEIYPNTYN